MPALISRAQWGARHGRGEPISGPTGHIVIHHEATPRGVQSESAEAAAMRSTDDFHRYVRDFDGIGYSFCVFPSGRPFEARGWLWSGAHTEGHNRTAYGICLMGDGTVEPATPAAWDTARWLISEGIRLGAVTSNPRITGHRDHKATACPGDHNYRLLGRLRGISGQAPEESEEGIMAGITLDDLDRIVRNVVRSELNQGTGRGQRSWSGTNVAMLDGVQRTFSVAGANAAVLEQLRQLLEQPRGPRGADAAVLEQIHAELRRLGDLLEARVGGQAADAHDPQATERLPVEAIRAAAQRAATEDWQAQSRDPYRPSP